MRLTTAKVWLHLDLVPSPVGGAAKAFLPPPLQTLFIILIISFPSSSVLPSRPKHVRAEEITQSSLRLSWTPGFGGDYPIIHCSVQVKKKKKDCVWQKCRHCLPLSFGDNGSPFTSLTLNFSCPYLPHVIPSLLYSCSSRSGFTLGKWPSGLIFCSTTPSLSHSLPVRQCLSATTLCSGCWSF